MKNPSPRSLAPLLWLLLVGGCQVHVFQEPFAQDDDDSAPELTDDVDGDGFTVGAGDCDDSDPLTNPNAVEILDAADNDCDLLVDHIDLTGARFSLTGESEGSRLGGAALAAGDVDGDGGDDFYLAAPGIGSESSRGRVYLVAGAGLSGGGVLERALGAIDGAADNDGFGEAMAALGDTSGDGLADVVIGAPRADAANAEVGLVYLVPGASAPPALQSVDEAASGSWQGERAGSHAGTSLAAGDLLGGPTVVVGTPDRAQAGSQQRGMAQLAGVESAGAAAVLGRSAASPRFFGPAALDQAGQTVAVGDVDGDGVSDLVVGVPGFDGNGDNSGAVFVLPGSATWADHQDVTSGVSRLLGPSGGQAGSALVVADFDGDGIDDIAVGSARAASNAGRVYIMFGGSDWPSEVRLPNGADAQLSGAEGEGLGTTLAAADLPSTAGGSPDGRMDLLIGTALEGGFGRSYIVRGSSEPGGVVAEVAAAQISAGDGSFLVPLGDLDGDGAPEVGIADPEADGRTGALHILYWGG